MAVAGIAMLAGVLLILGLPVLPTGHTLLLIGLPVLILASLWRRSRILIFVIAGAGWCWWNAQNHLNQYLAPHLQGRNLSISGWVASIPQIHPEYTSFEFAVQQLDGLRPSNGIPALIRLTWSDGDRIPEPGEFWSFKVRLKQPRGYMNPGGFDYEGWLFRHGIGATGYVIHHQAEFLNSPARFPLLRARRHLSSAIHQALPNNAFAGVIAALAVGERSGIDTHQWQVYQNTGTAHLLSISGLHIGLVAGLVFLLVRLCWRRSTWLCVRLPAPVAGACAAMLAAILYAAMAGFSVPTQRALIMLAAVVGATLGRRHSCPWDILGLALVAVLVLNPLSAGESGFWLSFGAVAAILYMFTGRRHARSGKVTQLLRTQWAVGIGLVPVLVFFFHRVSLVAPLANIVMVPIYSLVIVPLVLIGVVLLGIWHWAGTCLLKLAVAVISLTWPFLEGIADTRLAHLSTPQPSLVLVVIAVIGVLWLMLPKRFPARWLGAVLLLPLFLPKLSGIPAGGFTLTLLDVGQGLSAVVRTERHTLIYDTGPGFSEVADSGERVVIPWLQDRGVQSPDMTIISHADNDHAGGLRSLQAAFPNMPVLSGEPGLIMGARACSRGQFWEWDQVQFKILSPPADNSESGNDASCVLRVQGTNGSVLLVGDLLRQGEQRLLQLYGHSLASEVLVVPHHGSLTSSSNSFIRAVSPQYALFPVGYLNRWGFPKPAVVAAYHAVGAQLLDTATAGAVEIRLWPGREPEVVSRWRVDAARFWTTH